MYWTFGRVKDYIDLGVGYSWTCDSSFVIDRRLDGYVTNDRFMKLFNKLINVVADFNELMADLENIKMSVGSPKRKKTAPFSGSKGISPEYQYSLKYFYTTANGSYIGIHRCWGA